MFTIRNEQFALLRKQAVGDGLAKTFEQSGQPTEREAASGDVLVADARGHRTRFAFDKYGFIGSVTSPLGRTWRLENDEQGRLQTLTNPAGLRLGYAYNSQGRISSVARDASPLLALEYDEPGRPFKITYADQTATLIKYSPFNHPAAVTDRLGVTESYEYDSVGNLTLLTDGNGNQSAFDYSNRDRPDRVRYADGSTESYEYDPNGLVQKIVAGSAVLAVMEHDEQGHPTKISYEDGEVLSFRYNEQGKVIEARSAELTTLYEYDGAGRVVQEDQGGQVIKYEYDESGTLVALVYPSGEKVEFGYDEDLRLSSITDWSGGLHRFSYDLRDRETTLHSPNHLVTTIQSTPQGLPASLSVSRGSAGLRHLFALSYQYDAEDRLVSFSDSDFGSRRYAYDAEGRLLTAGNDKTGGGEVFAYDRAGNRTYSNGETAAFNSLNQLQTQGSTRCSYDGRGNLVTLSSPEGEWRFVYNSRNLLVRADGGSGQSLTFGYDAFGRRIWKRSGERETRYVWAGEQLVREMMVTDARTTQAQDYLYLPGTYTPVATRVDDHIYYYHTDHLGTPRRMTDSTGNVVWAADYSAFGLARPTVKTIKNCLRFPGQYADEETGLHYNRFRYYAPALGRYLSRDPLTYLSGLNFYTYAGNNPINNADPLGLWSWKTVVSVVAAVAVGIAVVALAPVALPLAIIAAGAAAGAVGAGLNEALNQETFNLGCIAKAALKGAFVGAIAALPFAFLPATAGVAAFMGAGAVSGALSYAADQFANYPDSKWDWKDFAISVGIGAATAGLGRYLGGKYAQWKQSRGGQSGVAGRNVCAKSKCTTTGHPVDVATGKVFTDAVDFELPGALSFRFERTWYSTSTYVGPLGHGWHHSYDLGLTAESTATKIRLADGRSIILNSLGVGGKLFDRRERLWLERDERGYRLSDDAGLTYHFAAVGRENGEQAVVAIEDRNGRRMRFVHDQAGRLTRIGDSAGRVIEFELDEAGRIKALTAPHPQEKKRRVTVATYLYDQLGNLISVSDALNQPFTYAYQQHLLIKETNRNGFSFNFEYDGEDSAAWCARTWGDGEVINHRLAYDMQTRTTTMTNSYDQQTLYRWTEMGLVVELARETGGVSQFVYDADGYLMQQVDELGQQTSFAYDERGNRTSITDAAGAATTLKYNELGLPLELTDANGNVWKREYDEHGNLTASIDPLGNRWEYKYNPPGALRSATNPKGDALKFDYDSRGYVSRLVDYGGGKHATVHDGWGRLLTRTDANGQQTEYTYDLLSRRTAIRQPLEVSYQFEFDAEGNPTRFVDADGAALTYSYESFNLLTVVKDEVGYQTSYRYDRECRCIEIINPEKATHLYTYDAGGRVVAEKRFDGLTTRYEYDLAGRLVRYMDETLRDIRCTRDAVGRLLTKTSTHGDVCRYEYDALGNLLTATNETSAVKFEYDAHSRVIREECNGFEVRSGYDQLGNRVSRKSPAGLVLYAYDVNSNLAEAVLPSDHKIVWQRDRMGDATGVQWPNALKLNRSFDALGRLASQHLAEFTGKSRFSQSYDYRGANSPTRIEDSQFGAVRLSYDERGFLRQALWDDGEAEAFSYDGAGELVEPPQRKGSQANQPQMPAQTSAPEYDGLGRTVARVVDQKLLRFVYNDFDRLLEAQLASGPASHYEYDALGRRIRKLVAGSIEKQYVWDGALVAEEHDPNGVSTFIQDDEETPVAVLHMGRAHFFENDHLSRPRRLFDETGKCVWAADYYVYGSVRRELVTGGAANKLRFPGQYYDDETGLCYNFQRYYDSDRGRYLTPDPLGLRSGGGLYQYTPNPLAWLDPLGLVIVYRNLRPDENPAAGLTAKNPGRGMTPAGHIMNGSSKTFKGSQYMSTSTDQAAIEKWRQPGQRQVAIDTDLIEADAAGNRSVVDVSTQEKAKAAGLKGRPYNRAVSSKEVLVEGRIPPKAITEVC